MSARVKTVSLPDRGKDQLGAGLGSIGADLNDSQCKSVIEQIRNRMKCSVMALKNVESTTIMFDGPQTDTVLKQITGATINPMAGFTSNPSFNGTVETTLAQPGEPQTNSIICAVGWHLEPEPQNATIPVNAWLPSSGAAQQQPISPNAFTANDLLNGALGPAGAVLTSSNYVPASLQWGGWANYAAWCMVRGYNLRWQVGQNTNLIYQRLRNIAYMPDSAQPGSASSSLLSAAALVRRTNDYYASLGLPATFLALALDSTRIGSATVGGVNVGVFNPTQDYDLVQATFGGIGLREELRCNSEFMFLDSPVCWGAGIPYGLIAEENDTDMGDTMRAYLSASQVGGHSISTPATIPPIYSPSAQILGTGTLAPGSPAALEKTLDSPSANAFQQYPSTHVDFKGGRFGMTVSFKGFEVSEDLYTCLKNNSKLREYICREAGLCFAQRGSGGIST